MWNIAFTLAALACTAGSSVANMHQELLCLSHFCQLCLAKIGLVNLGLWCQGVLFITDFHPRFHKSAKTQTNIQLNTHPMFKKHFLLVMLQTPNQIFWCHLQIFWWPCSMARLEANPYTNHSPKCPADDPLVRLDPWSHLKTGSLNFWWSYQSWSLGCCNSCAGSSPHEVNNFLR